MGGVVLSTPFLEVQMAFWGKSFIFNGISSENYDLRILDFDIANPVVSPSGGDVSIKEEWLYRRETPYFYGRFYETSLEFDFTVGSFSAIDGATRNAIQTWLLGKNTYLPLRIVQDDISDITYNVIFTRAPNSYVGNVNYALTLHAKCDRPWGLYYPPVFTKIYPGGLMSDSFTYLNKSTYSGYNKPTISFTMDGTGGSFSIINASDNNRQFLFTGLSPYETMTIDNDKGIITSSTGNLRITNFNKNFFRLPQGINNLSLAGYITDFSMTCVFPRGIGA